MKHILTSTLCLLLATVLLAVLPTDAEASIYDDTLRLHVLAASDSDEDQAIKLTVRDRILAAFGTRLGEATTLDEAAALAEQLLPAIEAYANELLRDMGTGYGAHVTLTNEWYDTRVYDTFTLPKGEYLSLRVILGEGDGQNWWCVMYPPMCLELATADEVDGYSEDEYRLIDGDGRTVKFKLLEVLSDLFR
ncbi:MAG: stage II sporulation protein R [Clostridia bacterium]|nr:stage II sporulation protein R [Clostridia bacterium]